MFNISVYVDDNKLVRILKGLDGLIVGEPLIRPVKGAAVVNGKIKSTQAVPGGSAVDNLAAKLRGKSITSSAIRDLITEIGGARKGSQYYIKELQKRKLLGKPTRDKTKGGKHSVYQILKGK